MIVIKRDGSSEPLNIDKIHKVTKFATENLDVSESKLREDANILFYNGIKTSDIQDSLIKAASNLISIEKPDYAFVAARLLLQNLYKEVTGGDITYPKLSTYTAKGVDNKLLNPKLLTDFDLDKLDNAIRPERDYKFAYLGLQTLSDRYLIRLRDNSNESVNKVIELPQHCLMRIAMGLALVERPEERTDYAIEFYNIMSEFDYVPSTPTLFNSGTTHSQLASCFLNTVEDSINGIFSTMQECANLSKYAGGIGTDWTRVRSAGDVIKGTNGQSSGVVPYLRIFNDTAVAVNQGGKRKGSFAAYVEPWHADIESFIHLKKNAPPEKRRAHDIYPALWIPDLFMRRVQNDEMWSLFSPKDFPQLHELYGEDFDVAYLRAEQSDKVKSEVRALDLWKSILTSLFETGAPWITFKDECNRRNPQSHCGVIHSSNLCTEITLNTSDDETAVCNLGSINLANMKSAIKLRNTIKTAMRMLDNVIDQNFYPSEKAKRSNLNHRPVGLGVMGYSEWLAMRGIEWDSDEHLHFANELFSNISWMAIQASSLLALEKGKYKSYKGSKWDEGILPIDTARNQDGVNDFNWLQTRSMVRTYGMRNSNVMAIAPTATIANIIGTTPCIEPIYSKKVQKENMSGYFDVVDPTMKYKVPCKTAFEIDPKWIIKAAAVRQKWIDQSQSLNIFVGLDVTGKELNDIYMLAWELGLKTTYYLRKEKEKKASEESGTVCDITDEDCQSCQ